MNTAVLIDRFQRVPVSAQQEIADFVEFISAKYLITNTKNKKRKKDSFKFNWEGALAEYKNQYTSVELQHQANQWRAI